VFRQSGSSWVQKRLQGGGESGEGRFGQSVALSGDGITALVGGRTDGGVAGAAWVFHDSGSAWEQQGSKLTVSGESPEGEFGDSVALSGDGNTALIGGPRDSFRIGAMWRFTRSPASTFSSPPEKLTAEDETGRSWFGASVALSGDGKTALAGGLHDGGKAGAAWAFAPGPTVEAVNPSEGPASGGTEVTITGTGFSEESEVSFGPHDAASVVFHSATSITVVSPPGEHVVHIRVFTPDEGTSPASPADEFAYASTGKRAVRPSVTGISPMSGPTAGGTRVTITGSGFDPSSVAAVTFGSIAAISYTVDSANEITAVSPAEVPAIVDVTVATLAAVSRTSEHDQFTFVAPQGPITSTSPVASGGVLGFGPFVVRSCTVVLRGKTIAVQSYKKAAVKLSWAGSGTCSGRLKLTVKTKIRHPKRGHARFKTSTIGTGTFSIAPGSVRTVKVNLNSLGRALLKAGRGRLNASIAIVKLSPGPTQARSASVRLALQKPKKATKRKR
jgi:hypothetical protein